jgi:predicted kinase
MKKVIITKGLPASGKSTWSKEMLRKTPGMYKRINKDDLRMLLDNSHFSNGNEKFIIRVRDWLIQEALKDGKHVIVDDTNLHPKHEARIREIVSEFNKTFQDNVEVEVKWFEISVEEAIRRDLNRPVSVGERVIRQQYEQFLRPKTEPIQQDASLPKAVLVDIDGTVAQKSDRSPFDWNRVGEDTPKQSVIHVVKSLKASGYEIIFFSGRDSVCRQLSIDWLKLHFNWQDADFQLFMRAENDSRKDSIVKKELFQQHIVGKYYIDLVIDDRNQVVEMWRKDLGLTCLQVDYGDF